MNKLVEEIIKPILEANPKIKKVVGIYGGRFQPFGPHHLKTYKWLTKQVDVAYITTSNIKKPPRHPMNFKEKVRHMSKMGVPSSKIIEEKTPYVANNVLKKFDKETTAVVYIFGQKDAGRLTGGTKKSGGKTYYQDYKKNKKNLEGYDNHGYILTAPHVSISVGGKEVSGTSMRELLGSTKFDDSERVKLFKKMFGYYNKGVFNMMTNKFKKLFEGADMEFKPTSMHYVPSKKRKLKKKHKDGKGQDLLKGQMDEDWLNKGSKKDRALKLKISKLYSKALKMMPGSPVQNKIKKEIEKLRNQLSEGVDLPIEIGDTVKMGKFKNKKVVVKTIDWNEKGDLLINGRPALKFRIMKEYIEDFLVENDIQTIINEASTTVTNGASAIDDGPRFFFGDKKSYISWNEEQAGKLGMTVVNHILKPTNYDMVGHETDYPNGPTGAVTYFPAGSVGKRAGTNVFGDEKGIKAFNLWDKHMQNIVKTIGWEFVDYLSSKLSIYSSKDEPMAPGEQGDESAGHINSKRTDIQQHSNDTDGDGMVEENTFSKEWWEDLLFEEQMLLDEGVKFNNFLKDWSKKSKQPFDKVNQSMNNKNTFAIAKLNDFSVDKVFDSAKKGFKTFQKVMNYVPNKVAKGLEKTKFGKGKEKVLGKLDDYLQKHPKLKRVMGVAAGAAITYAWTKMTFVGDPEYDLDLSAAAAAAAAGDYTMTDLFSGELGTKFLVLTAVGATTGLTMPYTKVLGTAGTFAAGISFGAYRAYKKRKDKKQKPSKSDTRLPDKVKNPNPKGRRKEVGLQGAVNWISKNKGNKAAKKFVQKLKTKNIKEVYDISEEVSLLSEGGAYGHMAHPFDDKDLTFGDLKKIITNGLGGQLSREDNVTEKLDGQNIMISWKDGKLIAARNKGHIKNGGKTALTTSGIASKFKGRGDIRNAFVYAMKDLEKSIKGLSDKQKEKIFNNGYNFMNLEVMWPKSANVIDYDVATLIFHGALIYDDKGNVKGEVKGSGRILAGMIQQINQHIQKKYSIGKPQFLTVPKHQDFGKMKGKFLGRLSRLQSQFGLKDNDTLALYHQMWWEVFISNNYKKKLSGKVVEGLVKRWAFFDKSYSIPMIKADMKKTSFFDEKVLQAILDFDKKDHAAQVKENMKPFETLFFEVGAEILKNVKGFMAANPDKAVQGIRKRLNAAISNVKAGGDKKKLNTLKLQLDKLNKIGGVDSIVPSEGIVFKYQGKTYKFTGAFAPINQITGLISF